VLGGQISFGVTRKLCCPLFHREQRKGPARFNLHFNPVHHATEPKEKIMSKAKRLVAVAIIAFITIATFVAENAHATNDPGNNPSSGDSSANPPPRSGGDPGNNPSGGSSGKPAPRSDNSFGSSNVIYPAPSNGKFKLDHTGYGVALSNGHVRNCRLCHIQ
jgi:hypothetical protein